MIETFFAFSRYFVALLFGTFIAVRFAGLRYTKKNIQALIVFIVAVFLFELCCLALLGMAQTVKMYPLLAHLPTLLLLIAYFKKSWLLSWTSVVIAFLCCQPLRWVGTLFDELFKSVTMNHVGYIVTGVILYVILEKYVVQSIYQMMQRSVHSCLLLAAMPSFYYVFDYATIVYTNFMYSGERIAVQFMPFIAATFYFVFVLLYYEESRKQLATQQHVQMLETQFKQAQKEFASLKQLHEQAAAYRHDMRHHLSLLQSLARKGHVQELQHYLQMAQSDLDAITPMMYCENDTVNLILSSFATKARSADITLTIDTRLPKSLPFSDTELCSLLSNALENAIHACLAIQEKEKRSIQLRLFSKNKKLCLDIQNSYQIAPTFHNGLPVSTNEAHGFGTKSIVHLIEKHGGIYRFSADDQLFIFQATI